jgi:hypothetical protein
MTLKMNRRKLLITSSALIGAACAGAIYWPSRWNAIVIHHSAGNFGNVDFLQQVHRERQAKDPIDAIPYHFIIGNGNGLGLGEVATGWRQKYDIWGAHVSGNNLDKNFRGLGICLIGNYEENPVPKDQYDALVVLTKFLMAKYSIAAKNVSGHGHTEGEFTKCPGKNFPMNDFLTEIA